MKIHATGPEKFLCMKGIIIYKGKYGATRQYAEWLSEDLKLTALPADDIMIEQFEDYDTLILGCSVYIGKLQLASWLKENLQSLSAKKIFLFLVSATAPQETDKLNEYIRKNVPDLLRKNIKVFYLHGRLRMKDLNWKDRLLLRIGAFLTKDKKIKKEMLTDFDGMKKENLDPIIKTLKDHFSSKQTRSVSSPLSILPEYF